MRYTCNLSDFKPIKSVFLNSNNEEIIKVEFIDFKANKEYKKEHFNEKQYLNIEESGGNKEEVGITVSSNYEIDGNTLTASKTIDNVTILCYSGEKPYTIVVQEVISYSEVVVFEEYTDVDFLDSGLCFINENSMRYYLEDYEISIYSNSLSIEEYLNIADAISLS